MNQQYMYVIKPIMVAPSKRIVMLWMKISLTTYSKTHKNLLKRNLTAILPDAQINAISKAICISLMFDNFSDAIIHPERHP